MSMVLGPQGGGQEGAKKVMNNTKEAKYYQTKYTKTGQEEAQEPETSRNL